MSREKSFRCEQSQLIIKVVDELFYEYMDSKVNLSRVIADFLKLNYTLLLPLLSVR